MRKIAVITPVRHLKGIEELLESKGQVVYYEKASKEEVAKALLIHMIDTIVCNPNEQKYKIDEELLKGTNVKTINSCSTGLNHIDLDYCKNNNIEIQCHKNDYELINNLPSTSELAFGLMMSLLRQIPAAQQHVKFYQWDYTQFIGRQIKGQNIGIVGYGRLGKMMYNYCQAFGANVKIYDPYVKKELSDFFLLNNWCSTLEELVEWSDVVSLHVHVTKETTHMINKKLFGNLKKSLYIVNTSRGEIVNEHDIVEALENKTLTGYATDVITDEFGDLTKSAIIKGMDNKLNIIATPHIGGMTWEGQQKAYEWSINKL